MSSRTDERELEKEFGEFGKIETVSVIYNRTTRESRGFGFITFEDKRDAVEAVDRMNGKRLDGREIRVDFSFTKDGRDGGGSSDFFIKEIKRINFQKRRA